MSTVPAEEKIAHRQEFPPPHSGSNLFPLSWPEGTAQLEEIWQASHREAWNPADLPWKDFRPEQYSWEQREALAYWWTLLAVFDATAPAVFASALVKTYTEHEEDVVRRCFVGITRDESVHEQMCRRSIEALLEHNDPLSYEPKSELGKRLRKNVQWLFYNGARYWERYQVGLPDYDLSVLYATFLVGEIAAATLFHQLAAACTEPVFQVAFRYLGRDEARHMGICLTLLERDHAALDAQNRARITRQIRTGYLYLSCVLFEPATELWDLPQDFIDNQHDADDVCRQVGLGVPDYEHKRRNWRRAMLNLKGVLERYDIPFPAIPELDIPGVEVPDIDGANDPRPS